MRFMDVELLVARGALVPRTETELLGFAALQVLRECPAPRVIDMCCGSGNLACALARHLPSARIWASDLTDTCVTLAQRNSIHAGVAGRVTVAQGDLFAGLAGLQLERTIDAVVCNPPYISQAKLAGERAFLLEEEPREAFDGGPYGLSIHQRVVKDALPFLRPGGALLFEIGLGQERQVRLLFERTRAYDDIQSIQNAAGEVRVVTGRKLTLKSKDAMHKQEIRNFVTTNFYVADPAALEDQASLLEHGIIDSTGVLEVIAFIEESFGITVDDSEMLPENLDSIERIAAFVARKQVPVAA